MNGMIACWIASAIAIIADLFLLVLGLFHFYLIGIEKTTFEFIMGKKDEEMKKKDKNEEIKEIKEIEINNTKEDLKNEIKKGEDVDQIVFNQNEERTSEKKSDNNFFTGIAFLIKLINHSISLGTTK